MEVDVSESMRAYEQAKLAQNPGNVKPAPRGRVVCSCSEKTIRHHARLAPARRATYSPRLGGGGARTSPPTRTPTSSRSASATRRSRCRRTSSLASSPAPPNLVSARPGAAARPAQRARSLTHERARHATCACRRPRASSALICTLRPAALALPPRACASRTTQAGPPRLSARVWSPR